MILKKGDSKVFFKLIIQNLKMLNRISTVRRAQLIGEVSNSARTLFSDSTAFLYSVIQKV